MLNMDVVNDALDSATGGSFSKTRTMCDGEQEARMAIKNRSMTITRSLTSFGRIGICAIEAWDNTNQFSETFFWNG